MLQCVSDHFLDTRRYRAILEAQYIICQPYHQEFINFVAFKRLHVATLFLYPLEIYLNIFRFLILPGGYWKNHWHEMGYFRSRSQFYWCIQDQLVWLHFSFISSTSNLSQVSFKKWTRQGRTYFSNVIFANSRYSVMLKRLLSNLVLLSSNKSLFFFLHPPEQVYSMWRKRRRQDWDYLLK